MWHLQNQWISIEKVISIERGRDDGMDENENIDYWFGGIYANEKDIL